MANKPAPSDASERLKALDPSRSFIVEAPAGSGKTTLLAQRYLRLLSEVERPETIVAMTFTRKAAAEIKDRIHDTLVAADSRRQPENDFEEQNLNLGRAALAQNQRHGWNLLNDLSRLQIQTIDSLCAMLTRQMPLVSQFGGVNQVIEDAREYYRLAARRTLRDLTEGNEGAQALFHRISLHFDNDMRALENQIVAMLQKRDQWQSLIERGHTDLVADFCCLLELSAHSLRDVFREKSTVDFSEITRSAITALGEPGHPSDLLYFLDYRIQHLLVDEFQDTSRAQYRLIDALTAQWSDDGEHTLFLVGDPMQSIYRFREAEVGLFLESWEQERLGAVRLNRVRLSVNFRSTPEIVNWTQKTFAPIMDADIPEEGAVKLRPSQASRSKGGLAPKIVAFIDDKGSEEAQEIVRILKSAAPKSSKAILVRSRPHLIQILPALRRANIAYEAVEIDELQNEQHILDLIALTRALLHVGDRVSWLACLRAPWCGLTVTDLAALAENESNRTVLDLISDPAKIAALTADSRIRLVRVSEILSAAVDALGRSSLRNLVEETWIALGGPAILRESNHSEDVDTFLDLIENFEEGGFIHDFSLLNDRLEFLYAKPVPSADCVQVLTIHKAKGLEFDLVILPKMAARPKSEERELLLWTETEAAAQPQKKSKDPAYDAIAAIIKQRDRHEMKRLFYVAATRARNELYMLASVDTNKSGTGPCRAPSNSFFGLIWDDVEHLFNRQFAQRQVQIAFDFKSQKKTVLRRLAAAWRTPRLDHSIDWEPAFRHATASARRISYEWVSDTARHVGTIVHELLKRGAQANAVIVKSELLRLGVARSEEPAATAQVLRALDNTFASERGRWILANHPEMYSELPVSGRIGDALITGTIDRLFREEDGRLWIVDFKTSEHLGARLEHFLDEEQRRYRDQLENYAVLVSRLMHGPISLGLYFPLLDGWREWQFEAAHYTSV